MSATNARSSASEISVSENRGERSRRLRFACASCVLAVAVAGALAGCTSGSSSAKSGSGKASGLPASTGAQTQSSCQVTQVVTKVLPSVVTITAKGMTAAGTGSGEIIGADGYILTNNHVIAPASTSGSASGSSGALMVQFSDGKTAAATVAGRDPLTDVAVIKVNETGLPAISPGSSKSLQVGEPVVVLGAPLGLSSTVTSGIVSALDRTVEVPGENSQAALLINAVQTDAAINPGNSGGALVNCAGQFVGIPSAGASVPSESGESSGGSIGLGFAIPADLALPEAKEIISTGKVSHAYLGIQAMPVSATAQEVNGSAEGLIVTGIDPHGPASEAGLTVGDVITEIAGQPAVSTDQLVELTLSKHPGDKVDLGYDRHGASRTVTLTFAAQP